MEGPALDKVLGTLLGNAIGEIEGVALGVALGSRLGDALGEREGVALGGELGPALGKAAHFLSPVVIVTVKVQVATWFWLSSY